MVDLTKTSRWSGTDHLLGLSTNEMGKCRFQHLVTAAQRIVFGVGNRRIIFLIVASVVGSDFNRQQLQLRLLRLGHRDIGRHCAISAIRLSAAARASSVILAPASMRAISSRRSSSDNSITAVVVLLPSVDSAIDFLT